MNYTVTYAHVPTSVRAFSRFHRLSKGCHLWRLSGQLFLTVKRWKPETVDYHYLRPNTFSLLGTDESDSLSDIKNHPPYHVLGRPATEMSNGCAFQMAVLLDVHDQDTPHDLSLIHI